MIFFDASAAAKRYFQEVGSDRVNRLWSGPEFFSSLATLRCELASALNRKRCERALPHGAYQNLKRQIEEDQRKVHAVPVNGELIENSLRLLDAHPLKTLDALYLAGALGLQQTVKEPVRLVAADRQLLLAARAEGLRVLNPEI